MAGRRFSSEKNTYSTGWNGVFLHFIVASLMNSASSWMTAGWNIHRGGEEMEQAVEPEETAKKEEMVLLFQKIDVDKPASSIKD